MTQRERKQRSKEKILVAAMAEFGTKDFDAVTMDGICFAHGISKGMMYHYVSGKDELFLQCVGHTFRLLARHVAREAQVLAGKSDFEAVRQYFISASRAGEKRVRERPAAPAKAFERADSAAAPAAE